MRGGEGVLKREGINKKTQGREGENELFTTAKKTQSCNLEVYLYQQMMVDYSQRITVALCCLGPLNH